MAGNCKFRWRKESSELEEPKRPLLLTVSDEEIVKKNKKRKILDFAWKYCQILVPITDWLRFYDWKECIVDDCCAGVTFACLSVPQGLAFSVLANCPLQYGLYTACFPAFIYSLLGLAHISSFGSVAIASMLTGEAVATHVHHPMDNLDKSLPYVSTLTFLVGLFYLVLSIIRMGVLVRLFRKPFVSAYIAACSCHILIKSARLLVGVQCETFYGFLNFYYNAEILVRNLGQASIPTVTIAAVGIAILLVNMIWFKDWFHHYSRFALPIEGIVLILFTLLSFCFKFQNLGVKIVGKVPTGVPRVIPPDVELAYEAFPHAVSISVINFAQSIAMVMLYNENFSPNQEAFAMAISNIICASFQCLTIGNSLMRTAIAINVGVKTLLATTISSLLMVLVISFAGTLFNSLPICILGCIIFTAMGKLAYDMFLDLPSLFRASKQSGWIWIVTFISSIVGTVQIGLIVGLCLCLKQILDDLTRREKASRDAALAEVAIQGKK